MSDHSQPGDPYATEHHPQVNFAGSDGIATTFIVAIVLLTLVVCFRPRSQTGLLEQDFWQQKIQWSNCVDVVVAGDSRINRGVSPEAMQASLPESRILNYGFAGCGYSEEYLESVAAMLADDSAQQVIVLGITPRSFTATAIRENRFTATQDAPRQMATPEWLAPIYVQFRPMRIREVPNLVRFAGKPYGPIDEFHADGWAAGDRVPINPKASLPEYRELFAREGPVEEHIDRVLAFVKEMTARNVHVYGVRPPVGSGMLAIEQELSGFDQAAFVTRFEKAGGIWLEVEGDSYQWYDGSHMTSDSARRFSTWLGEEIAQHEAAGS